jgi:hypothetical protein
MGDANAAGAESIRQTKRHVCTFSIFTMREIPAKTKEGGGYS